MDRAKQRIKSRDRIRRRVRSRISGTAVRPRLTVFKSLGHIYVQAIDDESGTTLAQASSRDKELGSKTRGKTVATAKAVGELVASRILDKGIDSVVFDRGGYPYHGRVKAVADAAREKGLKF